MTILARTGLVVLGSGLILGSSLSADQGADDPYTSRHTALTRAIERVSPAVAGINVIKLQKGPSGYSRLFSDPFWANMFPETYRRVESLGSGLVISSDGYVVTNAHVVENAAEIIVTLPGGMQYDVADVFTDALTDIALLKIEAQNLPIVRLGDSDDLIIGEWAIALGNPLGLFDVSKQPTATVGIISGLNMDFGHKEPGRVYQDMIQTDAAINPGNSGGPLVNANGEVIGLNSFIFTENDYSAGSIGIGFAIPVDAARRFLDEVRAHGRVREPWSGIVGLKDLTRRWGQYLDLSIAEGALVTGVVVDSPAYESGLARGDVIVSINGENVRGEKEAWGILRGLRVGDMGTLVVVRSDGRHTVAFRLQELQRQQKRWY
ncbi:MAG: trypsin-like peptidase domain-containing protein [Candidatus Marinimicrobia bacterium]|nr:trypsin-like peptidase domain-containing protein [Candidatus Neomarinimicrobiota bacterium]